MRLQIWFPICFLLGEMAVCILGPLMRLESDSELTLYKFACVCYQVFTFCYDHFLILLLLFCLDLEGFKMLYKYICASFPF